MSLVFLDDARARDFAPFALTRPGCELRAGAELIRRRWEMALGEPGAAFVGASHLADFEEPGAPPFLSDAPPSGSIVVNSRCAPGLISASADADVWRCDGRVAAVRLAGEVPFAKLAGADSLDSLASPHGVEAEVAGWWIENVWDLIRHLSGMLTDDVPRLAAMLECEPSTAVTRTGAQPVFIEPGASIEPHVVFDVTGGPILVRRGARVHSFTRLAGPCVVGENSMVYGGRLATVSIGDNCRVHGELSTTIFIGHDNKGHDGFIGHSVLGRWVNLGASTVNSNLKNTYGPVSLWTPAGMEKTGLQFLGTFFGDHAKTAIGTRLTTGCVVGAGANVFGSAMPPKVVPPFAWGVDGSERWALDRFVEVASRVMERRNVSLGERARRQLAAAFALAAGDAP